MDICFQNVTLQLLTGTDRSSVRPSENEKEEEKDRSDEVKQREEKLHQNEYVNGERKVKEDHVIEPESHQVSETQMDEQVGAEEEPNTVTESKTQIHPNMNTELKLQETPAAEFEVQQEHGAHFVPETSAEENTNKSADPDKDKHGKSLPCENEQEAVSEMNSTLSSEVDKESDNGTHVGEINIVSTKAFGPPINPPPPPTALQNSSGKDTW